MTRAHLQPGLRALRGAMGEIVFKHVRGKQFITKKSVSKKAPSAAQRACRQRFKEAGDYAKMAQDDPALWVVYEPVALERQVAVYTVALKDFLNAPKIRSIFLMFYHGNPGESISIHAEDDFGLAELEVSLTGPDGTPVERGQAVEEKPRSGRWTYQATAAVAPGTRLVLEVTGADYAGNRVQVNEELAVGETKWIDIKVEPRRTAKQRRRPQPRMKQEVLKPEEAVAAAPLCEAAGLAEAPCSPALSQPAEAIAGLWLAPEPGSLYTETWTWPVTGSAAPTDTSPLFTDAARSAEPREMPPAGDEKTVMAGTEQGEEEALGPTAGSAAERLPVRVIWWVLLTAVRLRYEVPAEFCGPEVAGGSMDMPAVEREVEMVMKSGLAPPQNDMSC